MAEDIDIAGLLQQFITEYGAERSERQKIYEQGQTDLGKVVEAYEPGGGATSGLLQEGMAPVEQSMVSRGLSGTTRPGAVRAGMAADIEAQRVEGLAKAKTAKAEFGAGFQDIYPTAGTLSHLATGGFSGLLSREIAEMGPDYASRADYGVPSIAPSGGGGGVSSSGGAGGGMVPSGIDSGYENKLYGELGGGGTGGDMEGLEFTPWEGEQTGPGTTLGTWAKPSGSRPAPGSRESVYQQIMRGSTTV